MEIIINSKKLTDMLKIIEGAVYLSKKNNISSNILIKKIKNNLFCVSINEDIEIVTFNKLEKLTDENIDIIVNYNILYSICRSLKKNSEIKIIKKINTVEIITDNSMFELPVLNNSIFPSFKNEKNFLINTKLRSDEFKKLINYPYAALSESNDKEFLNGILLDINENSINAIGSDTVKTAFAQIILPEKMTRTKILIPKLIIKEFLTNFIKNENIFLIIYKNIIKLVKNDITITSRLLDDKYENYITKIIYDIPKKFIIKTDEFKKAINLLNIICTNNVIVLNIKNDKITLYVKNKSDFGQTIIKTYYSETEINLNLNLKHLNNILKIINSNNIELLIQEKIRTIIIKEEYSNCIYITLPLKYI